MWTFGEIDYNLECLWNNPELSISQESYNIWGNVLQLNPNPCPSWIFLSNCTATTLGGQAGRRLALRKIAPIKVTISSAMRHAPLQLSDCTLRWHQVIWQFCLYCLITNDSLTHIKFSIDATVTGMHVQITHSCDNISEPVSNSLCGMYSMLSCHLLQRISWASPVHSSV